MAQGKGRHVQVFCLVSSPAFQHTRCRREAKFWKAAHFAEFAEEHDVKIVLFNTREERDRLLKDEEEHEAAHPNFVNINGDARNMKEFDDKQFEVVFSNSVIEHVGNYDQQRQMAKEIRRVGERYFLQTPNRFFPIEPHFVFPFFQFLPLRLKVFLLCNFKIGAWDWSREISDRQTAVERASEIRLLTEKELKTLFPEANIHKEKFCGMTKSFKVYYSPDERSNPVLETG